MSNWQRTLDLKDVWEKACNKEISFNELAQKIAERLVNIKPLGIKDIDEQLITLIAEFEFLADVEDLDVEEVNHLLRNLYDWGDISIDGKFGGKKVCWIKTFF